jgi:hypothetical protein
LESKLEQSNETDESTAEQIGERHESNGQMIDAQRESNKETINEGRDSNRGTINEIYASPSENGPIDGASQVGDRSMNHGTRRQARAI